MPRSLRHAPPLSYTTPKDDHLTYKVRVQIVIIGASQVALTEDGREGLLDGKSMVQLGRRT